MTQQDNSSGPDSTPVNHLIFSIPYFGGVSRAAFSDQFRRKDYLCRTIYNIQLLSAVLRRESRVHIHVATDEDFLLVSSLFGPWTSVTLHTVPPIFLATASLRHMQAQSYRTSDFIYHTEADQIIHHNVEGHLESLDEFTYLAPHRFEEIPSTKTRIHTGVEFLEYDGRRYIVCNRADQCDTIKTAEERYYLPKDRTLAFGGAFLSTFGCLRRANFQFSEELPVEHASGFDMFAANSCRKTVDVLDFFVIHLSGFEFNMNRNPLLG
jgi:hypothetical protein